MSDLTPPATAWSCSKCGRPVADGIQTSFDPRYATGLCRHGDPEREPARIQLAAPGVVELVIDQRKYHRDLKRARAHVAGGVKLSRAESAALARFQREQAAG